MMAALSDMMVSVTVGMDGVYTFTNVKPGTYYVHATVAGYIDPLAAFSSDDLTSKDPGVREKICGGGEDSDGDRDGGCVCGPAAGAGRGDLGAGAV